MNKDLKLKLIKEVFQEVKESMSLLASIHLSGVEAVVLHRVECGLEVNGDKLKNHVDDMRVVNINTVNKVNNGETK